MKTYKFVMKAIEVIERIAIVIIAICSLVIVANIFLTSIN